MFSEEFLESLPPEPLLAIVQVINYALEVWGELPGNQEHQEYEFFLEAFAIVRALANNVSELEIELPELRGTESEITDQAVEFFRSTKTSLAEHFVALKMAQFNNKYQAKFGNTFCYEFSEGDVKRIQAIINSLRDEIRESSLFEEDHKQRILRRLEKVQAEMHKKMSDLDRFWGLIGDAGVVLGKFGEDAKPFVDRIKEISEIVWRTQSRAEELPSDTPMGLLPEKEEKA